MSKKENLKEMGDVSSGMASTVIQLYLKGILNSFLHPSIKVRQDVLKVIQLILAQGLVHPVQVWKSSLKIINKYFIIFFLYFSCFLFVDCALFNMYEHGY